MPRNSRDLCRNGTGTESATENRLPESWVRVWSCPVPESALADEWFRGW